MQITSWEKGWLWKKEIKMNLCIGKKDKENKGQFRDFNQGGLGDSENKLV